MFSFFFFFVNISGWCNLIVWLSPSNRYPTQPRYATSIGWYLFQLVAPNMESRKLFAWAAGRSSFEREKSKPKWWNLKKVEGRFVNCDWCGSPFHPTTFVEQESHTSMEIKDGGVLWRKLLKGGLLTSKSRHLSAMQIATLTDHNHVHNRCIRISPSYHSHPQVAFHAPLTRKYYVIYTIFLDNYTKL